MITMTLYILASTIIGWWGRSKELGFAKSFLISMILSPVLGAFFVWISVDYVETDEEVLDKIHKLSGDD